MRRIERQARLRFIEPAVEAKTWRFEWVEVKGRPQMRYRDVNTGRFIRKP